MKKLLILLAFAPLLLLGQSTKVGVRAGLDFSTLVGPTETAESFGVSTGFHFGVNVSRYLTSTFGLRAELLYSQKGFRKEYNGVGYYPIKVDGNLFYTEGDIDYILEVSNAYASIPLTAHIQPFSFIEFFAGISANFLINPVGSGTVDFTSTSEPDRLFFRQTLQHAYYQDTGGMVGTSPNNPVVFVGEEIVTIPGAVGAYYIFDNDEEKVFRGFDVSAIVGTQIYVNKSFYIGLRAEYGFRDITNDAVDLSIESLSDTGGFKLNNDKDHQVGLQASVGFRF